MNTQHFISFEGIDGCGKSTQLRMLRDWLEAQGIEVVATREPGDTALGMEIRSLLLDGNFVPCAEAELLLFLADRAQHVRELILPALQRGAWVLCDRYTDSTLAYQLAARRLDTSGEGALNSLLAFAECRLRPDLTLWFDLAVHQASGRMRQRQLAGEESTRLDDESAAFHQRVAEAFVHRHAAEPDRIIWVDAAPSADQIHDMVRRILSDRWPELDQ